MTSANESDQQFQEVPDDYEPNYPPSPSVKSVETSGSGVMSPSDVEIEIEYFVPGNAETSLTTVIFWIARGTAKLRDVRGHGRLHSQIQPILAATEAIGDHPAVDSVEGLEYLISDMTDFIEASKRQEEEEEME